MKHLKLFESFNLIKYEFSINDDKYLVEFRKMINMWELLYYIWDGKSWSVSKLGPKGNIYKIIDLVFGKYLNRFINDYNPKEILIEGLSKDKEKEYVSQRTRVYLRYLKRNTPIGWEIYPKGNPINNIIKLKYIGNETSS